MSPPHPPKPIYWDVDVELSMENAAWLLEKVARLLRQHARARRKQTEPPRQEEIEADVEELRWNLDSCERIERELYLVALHLAAEEGDFEQAVEVRRILAKVSKATLKVQGRLEEAMLELDDDE